MITDVIDWFAAPLQFAFMQRALLVSVVAGAVGAVLSCWLVLMGWSLLGDAVSHAVLPGVVLSYLLGLPFAIGAFVFGAGAVGLIGLVNRTSRIKEDTAIGIVFISLFAFGVVLVSRTPSNVDLFHILFGNVLGVSTGDIVQILVISAITLVLVGLKRRDLMLLAFDRTHAHAIGLNPRRLEVLLLGLLALTVVVALRAVGIVLVVAMVIIPGATAYLLTDRFAAMLRIAAAVAVVCAVVGCYASFHLNISTGGAIVVSQGIAFVLAYLGSPTHGVIARGLRARAR